MTAFVLVPLEIVDRELRTGFGLTRVIFDAVRGVRRWLPDRCFCGPFVIGVVGFALMAFSSGSAAETPGRSAEEIIQAAVDAALDNQNVPLEHLQLIQSARHPADASIRMEEVPEQILSANGDAAKLLASAGVTDVDSKELVGLVVDAKGKAIPDVIVDAWSWYPGNETTTDAKGLFRLKGFDPKMKVQLVFKKEGYSPRMITSRLPGQKDFVVILRDDTYFEGTVDDFDNLVVEGAKIMVSCGPFEPNPGYQIGDITFEAVSGANGKYWLYVFPNNYDFKVIAAGRGVSRDTGVAILPSEQVEHAIHLQHGVKFEAKVIDSVTNEPFEGFALYRWQPPFVGAKSDAQGRIMLDDLFEGEISFECGAGKPKKFNGIEIYENGPLGRWWSADAVHEHQKLQIDKPRLGWQRNFDGFTFQLEHGMKPVEIIVEQGVTISGHVLDPEGNPVSGATVAPALTGTGNSLTGDTRYSVRSDKDGKYRVVLPASNDAEYNLIVHDGKYEQWRKWANGVTVAFQTKPGQVIENKDLKLTVPAVVRGKVTSLGEPVANRAVRSHDFDKMENRYYDPTVKTGADGTFELKFVRPGKHYVQAEPFWMDAENGKGSVVVEVEAGDVLDDLELTVDGQ